MRFTSILPVVAIMGLAACASEKPVDAVAEASKMFDAMPVKTMPVRGNISVVSGVGGNVLVIAGKDGTTLADTGVTPRVELLDGELAKLHAKPVTTVIDSHFHFDHTGGNAHYGAKGAQIIAQENVKARLMTPQKNEFFGLTFPAAPAEALPTKTFSKSYALNTGGHRLTITHPPKAAHTDGDAFIKVADANVIFTGDIFFNKLYPFIDYGVGGNIDGMIAATDAVLATSTATTKIIPGHGDIASKTELKAYRTMLATIGKRIHALKAAGKTEDEAVAAKPTADFDAVWGHGLFTGEQFTRIVYRGIAAKK